MSPRKQAEKELKEAGFEMRKRKGHDHDIFLDPITQEFITLRRSSHFDENELKRIRSEIRSILRMREKLGR